MFKSGQTCHQGSLLTTHHLLECAKTYFCISPGERKDFIVQKEKSLLYYLLLQSSDSNKQHVFMLQGPGCILTAMVTCHEPIDSHIFAALQSLGSVDLAFWHATRLMNCMAQD